MTFKSLVNDLVNSTFNAIYGLAISIAILLFFYGVFKYIWATRSGDTAEIKKGSAFLLWGLIALFVLTTFNPILNFFSKLLF